MDTMHQTDQGFDLIILMTLTLEILSYDLFQVYLGEWLSGLGIM